MQFKNAIVRRPCPEMIRGLRMVDMGQPDFDLALKQHDVYIRALEDCGLSVQVLPADSAFPDSCFVEDVALCLPEVALLCRPGAPSRTDEAVGFEKHLKSWFPSIKHIEDPATLEGGDIMVAGKTVYIGLSARSNSNGISQAIHFLTKYGYTVHTITVQKGLHLKSDLSYLENNQLLIGAGFKGMNDFDGFNQIEVDPDEAYAANSVWINERVLVPDGFPKTRAKIEDKGLQTIPVPTSEFQKLDGGLSCLSLRF